MVRLTVNHDAAAKLFADALDKLKGESTQSVTMGNHDFCDASFANSFQKFDKTGPFPVETASNVTDEPVLRESSGKVVSLSLEVSALFVTADSGITHLFCRFCLCWESNNSSDVGNCIVPLAQLWCPPDSDKPLVGP